MDNHEEILVGDFLIAEALSLAACHIPLWVFAFSVLAR
jgi:hypothetical protein